MSDWLALLWRKKNYLLGVFAVLAIVLATVWIYGGNREQSKDAMHTVSSAAVGQETADKDNFIDTSEDSVDSSTGTTVTKPNGATPGSQSEKQSAAQSKQNEAGNEKASSATGSEISKAEKSTDQDAKEASSHIGKNSSSSTAKNKDTSAMKGKQESEKQGGKSSTGSTPTPKPGAAPPSSDTVQITIVGSSDAGTILSTEEIDIGDSETVLDILKKATRASKIQMEYSGSGATAYIKGIDNLYEFDNGSGSGWMYSVNNKFPNRSAGVWSIKPGDYIQWLYTEDLGKDVGAGAEDGLWDGKS